MDKSITRGPLKGYFKARNRNKYKGDPTNIIYRSSWELKMMMNLDHDPNVEWWQSEEMYVPYRDPTRNMIGHYYPDFIVKYIEPSKTVMYEIKPKSQTLPPLQNGNKKRFIREALTYARNLAKWDAAQAYCNGRGFEFVKLTENELYGRKN